jgi:hypothetical protein
MKLLKNKIVIIDLIQTSPMKDGRDILIQLAEKISAERSETITLNDVGHALFMLLGDRQQWEWIFDVTDNGVSDQEAYEVLKSFDFSQVKTTVETQVDLLEGMMLYQTKVKIKAGGTLWYIHRYDADPFPSSPHAHNIEHNIKLDLSNGNCFRNRRWIKTISRKDLLSIREKATKLFKGELPALQ